MKLVEYRFDRCTGYAAGQDYSSWRVTDAWATEENATSDNISEIWRIGQD